MTLFYIIEQKHKAALLIFWSTLHSENPMHM